MSTDQTTDPTSTPASHLERELFSQPDAWAQAVGRLAEVSGILPQAGERVAVIGCGTSFFMAQAYAERRESLGQGVTDAFAASEHHLERGYDRAVVICRSGTTSEIIAVIHRLKELGINHTSIVATAGTPVADESDHTILLSEADEESVVQTRFATTNLALLLSSLGDDLAPAIADARAVLAESVDDAVGALREVEQMTFLGTGWTVGLANEAALKLRETAQFWAESYPATEYRHGPISIATTGRAVWAFGEVPSGLADQVAATGAHFEHRDLHPLAELVRVHRLCLLRAELAGLEPDSPRHLTRSIVLA